MGQLRGNLCSTGILVSEALPFLRKSDHPSFFSPDIKGLGDIWRDGRQPAMREMPGKTISLELE
jgi:hypothetical protein